LDQAVGQLQRGADLFEHLAVLLGQAARQPAQIDSRGQRLAQLIVDFTGNLVRSFSNRQQAGRKIP
jgi:hypothetical protein